MKSVIKNQRYSRIILIIGVIMLALVPTPALAHDNLGGDDLAVANWMLVFAMVTVVIGALWAIWGLMNGQFNGIESSKYTMLDTADDYEAIMAEFDAEQKASEEEAKPALEDSTIRVAGAEPIVVGAKPGGKTLSI
jgi:hypothetical protein